MDYGSYLIKIYRRGILETFQQYNVIDDLKKFAYFCLQKSSIEELWQCVQRDNIRLADLASRAIEKINDRSLIDPARCLVAIKTAAHPAIVVRLYIILNPDLIRFVYIFAFYQLLPSFQRCSIGNQTMSTSYLIYYRLSSCRTSIIIGD